MKVTLHKFLTLARVDVKVMPLRMNKLRAASLFANHPEYEAWGWEIHHSAKKDAPSGTLKQLEVEMRAAGFSAPVPLSASRAGTHVGTHEIGFDSPSDTITLRHSAKNREGYARGALLAARWLIGKKGVFEFREVVADLESRKAAAASLDYHQ